MTKQEIQRKITQAENEIRQHNNNINSWRSRTATLESRVSDNRSQIDQLNAQIREKESQIEELNALKGKYQNVQSGFADRQSCRVQRFNLNFVTNALKSFSSLRVVSSYVSGMASLLSGGEYRNAYNGLGSAVQTIADKIQAIQREIDSLRDDIAARQRSIDSFQQDADSYRRQIDRANSEISDCRRRISRWQEDLRTAV